MWNKNDENEWNIKKRFLNKKYLEIWQKWLKMIEMILHYVPCVCISITVTEVVHVQAVLLQAAGTLLDPRQEAPPVAASLPLPVQPPGQWTPICNNAAHTQSVTTATATASASTTAPAQLGQGHDGLYSEDCIVLLHCFHIRIPKKERRKKREERRKISR